MAAREGGRSHCTVSLLQVHTSAIANPYGVMIFRAGSDDGGVLLRPRSVPTRTRLLSLGSMNGLDLQRRDNCSDLQS